MSDLPKQIERFVRLPPLERWFLIRACVGAPFIAAVLPLIGLRRLQAWNAGVVGRASSTSPEELRALLALAARALSALPIHSSCLARALAFQWLLNRDGINTQLRIGARLVDRQLDAHAWLEFEGHPITDRPEALRQFAVFEACTPPRAQSH